MSGIRVSHLPRLLAGALLAAALSACQTVSDARLEPAPETSVATALAPETAEQKYFPSSEPLRAGLDHFKRGNHGLAEKYFRDAVEKSPRNAKAWTGLAAAYDHIQRFDLADRAYRTAIGLTGETTQILNNQGYSYMMRGDYKTAAMKFRRAYQREPNNPTIINNLRILDAGNQPPPRAS